MHITLPSPVNKNHENVFKITLKTLYSSWSDYVGDNLSRCRLGTSSNIRMKISQEGRAHGKSEGSPPFELQIKIQFR